MITHITAVYFFFGFVAGLVFVELTDGKPAVKVDYSNMDTTIYIQEPWPIHDTPQQDTFNSQRPNNNGGRNNE
jgi:hypothetical protein